MKCPSCLTWAQNWGNIEAMWWIWIIFSFGISYCLEFSTTCNSHAARRKLPCLLVLRNLFTSVFSLSSTLPYFGKITDGNQALIFIILHNPNFSWSLCVYDLFPQVGDEILEINGRSTEDIPHADAIALIKSGRSRVRLLIHRHDKPTYLGQCVFISVWFFICYAISTRSDQFVWRLISTLTDLSLFLA